MVVGREKVSYHIRLIIALNQISGNPCIWPQSCERKQLPNHIKYCVCFYFIAYITCLLYTHSVPHESLDSPH